MLLLGQLFGITRRQVRQGRGRLRMPDACSEAGMRSNQAVEPKRDKTSLSFGHCWCPTPSRSSEDWV